jgi:hypothetical protein
LSGVAEHGSVDNVEKMVLEDSHRFAAGVAVDSGSVVELSGAWFVAELDHCDAVDRGIEAPVSAAREAVLDGFAFAFT